MQGFHLLFVGELKIIPYSKLQVCKGLEVKQFHVHFVSKNMPEKWRKMANNFQWNENEPPTKRQN